MNKVVILCENSIDFMNLISPACHLFYSQLNINHMIQEPTVKQTKANVDHLIFFLIKDKNVP